jgi:hypothetical protein
VPPLLKGGEFLIPQHYVPPLLKGGELLLFGGVYWGLTKYLPLSGVLTH